VTGEGRSEASLTSAPGAVVISPTRVEGAFAGVAAGALTAPAEAVAGWTALAGSMVVVMAAEGVTPLLAEAAAEGAVGGLTLRVVTAEGATPPPAEAVNEATAGTANLPFAVAVDGAWVAATGLVAMAVVVHGAQAATAVGPAAGMALAKALNHRA
jgi:hypothetical protein